MPLTGVDVSGHQTKATLAAWLPKVAFVIAKASEGVGFADPMHASHVTDARASGKLVGHYHFARPDTTMGLGPQGDATKEAGSFVSIAGARPGEVMVCDFEPYNQPIDMAIAPEWILAFTAEVTRLTGAPCWLYGDGSMLGRVLAAASATQAAALRRLPLWKALPGTSSPGSALGWPAITCWQRLWQPVDQNTFYGDADTWRSLGIPAPTTTTQEDDMPLTPDDAKTIWQADIIPSPTGDKANPYWQPDSYLQWIFKRADAAARDSASALAVVKAMAAAGKALTADQIEAASKTGAAAALDERIADATAVLTVTPGA